MNRFQKYCMRNAKRMKKESDPSNYLFNYDDFSVYQLYKANQTLLSSANLEKLLKLEKESLEEKHV